MLCKSILKKKCNESRKKKKKNNYIKLKLDVRLALKKNKSRKAWKYEKKNTKINNKSFTVSHPNGISIFQWNFFKAMIPDKDDSEESSENNCNIFIWLQMF